MPTIRPVSEHTDWEAIAKVFNHYVHTSTAAYPSLPLSGQFFQDNWSDHKDYPFYEVRSENETVGFCYMRPFHPADTMSNAVVLTYFIAPSHTAKGIGQQLLERLLKDGLAMGKTNFLVSISSDNEGSINFHRKNAFAECGRFKSVAKKFGKTFDMVWMQRIASSDKSIKGET